MVQAGSDPINKREPSPERKRKKRITPHLRGRKKGCSMPQNGETNEKLGFYKNQCCGKEIVVPAGTKFPGCPHHPGPITIWESLIDDNDVQLIQGRKYDRPLPRFNIGDRVVVTGLGPYKGEQGDVVNIVEGALEFEIRLNDATTIRCFGFELELVGNESKVA